jgi:hypothetical protein
MVVFLLILILIALCGGKDFIKLGFALALMVFGLAMTPQHAHALPSAAECRAGEMDASSMDRYCPPGRARSMVASGHCWHSGEYGYQNQWLHGKANAAGDCIPPKYVPPPSGCPGHPNYVAGIECEDGL